jgi:hypothetical protein
VKKKLLRIASVALPHTHGAVLATGCKQGRGERCQVNEDCESPLTCNLATKVCVSPGDSSGEIDAAAPAGDAMPDTTPAAVAP